jgi:hypothetical protein
LHRDNCGFVVAADDKPSGDGLIRGPLLRLSLVPFAAMKDGVATRKAPVQFTCTARRSHAAPSQP